MNEIKTANDNLIQAVREARAAMKKIADDPMIPAESKPKLIEEERAKHAATVREAADAAKAAIATSRKTVKDAAERGYLPAGDPVAGIAADEQVWRRIKDVLDSGVAPEAVLEDAVARGDQRTVKVLGEEFRHYAWVKYHDPNVADAMEPLFTDAKAKTSDAYASAMEAVGKIDKADRIVNFNAVHATKAVADDSEPGTFVDVETRQRVDFNPEG